jgi:predicted ATP-grasp superfamily ATP-dependent carboligase
MHARPAHPEPALVLAFEGWNDAGAAASEAVRHLEASLDSTPVAEIDLEEFLDLTVHRPEVRLDAGAMRRIEWPVLRIQHAEAGTGRSLLTGWGPEPHLRWRAFCDAVLALVREAGVRRVALLGAFLADVLYSLPVRVSGFASDPSLLAPLGVTASGYEGPTGIVGVLGARLRDEGVETVSLWAGLPHYIDASPNPRGALALLQVLRSAIALPFDEEPLVRAAAEFEQKVSALVSADPVLAEYVRELKRREFAQ